MRTIGAGTTSLVKRAGWLGIDNGIAGLEGSREGMRSRFRDYEKLPSFQNARIESFNFLRVIELSNMESRVDIIGVEAS